MPSTQLAHASPKRKRDLPPQIPLLNTALRTAATPQSPPRQTSPPNSPLQSSGANSPRNAVADQLRDLNIDPPLVLSAALSPLSPVDDGVHKKPRLGEESPSRPERDSNVVPGQNDASQSSTPKSGPRLAPNDTPNVFRHSPSPQPFTLTWHESEITGHLVDPSTDPDDDGTGLNGIGFKPTPAIAYARSQKRKQQLFDWKARESREARAKRSERRRREVEATSSRGTHIESVMAATATSPGRRTVKFAV